ALGSRDQARCRDRTDRRASLSLDDLPRAAPARRGGVMSVLTARNVTISIGKNEIVRDASLSLAAGELVALVGPNGAGKTTLMRALAGLLSPQGTIMLAGKRLESLSPRERARMVSYLPQGHI